MSDLSELIKITKNIENQNNEIIRLLKKIAGEDEETKKLIPKKTLEDYAPDFGDLFKSNHEVTQQENEKLEEIENSLRIGTLLENSIEVGEVYFIEGEDIFKLTINNNETTIDNLTGNDQPTNFKLQEMIANESIKNNVSLEDSTVILSMEQSQNLPETLRISVEQNANKIYMPLSASTQLISAPQYLMDLIKFDFYKTEEQLIEKLFKK